MRRAQKMVAAVAIAMTVLLGVLIGVGLWGLTALQADGATPAATQAAMRFHVAHSERLRGGSCMILLDTKTERQYLFVYGMGFNAGYGGLCRLDDGGEE